MDAPPAAFIEVRNATANRAVIPAGRPFAGNCFSPDPVSQYAIPQRKTSCYNKCMATVNISFRLDKKKSARLDSLAKSAGRTRTEVINEAIESHFFLQELILAKIDAGIKDADEGRFAADEAVQAEFARWHGKK